MAVYVRRFEALDSEELGKVDANLAVDEADIHARFPCDRPRFWEQRFIAVVRMRAAIAEILASRLSK